VSRFKPGKAEVLLYYLISSNSRVLKKAFGNFYQCSYLHEIKIVKAFQIA